MALYALGRTHLTEEDLLGDLLEWDRMDAIHSSDSRSKEAKPAAKKNDLKVSKPGVHASTRFKPDGEKTTEGVPNSQTETPQTAAGSVRKRNICQGIAPANEKTRVMAVGSKGTYGQIVPSETKLVLLC